MHFVCLGLCVLCIYVFVCMCVYLGLHMFAVYMYVCLLCICVFVCVCIFMCVCLYLCCTCVCFYVYICFIYVSCVCIGVYVCVCALCVYACVCVSVCVREGGGGTVAVRGVMFVPHEGATIHCARNHSNFSNHRSDGGYTILCDTWRWWVHIPLPQLGLFPPMLSLHTNTHIHLTICPPTAEIDLWDSEEEVIIAVMGKG